MKILRRPTAASLQGSHLPEPREKRPEIAMLRIKIFRLRMVYNDRIRALLGDKHVILAEYDADRLGV